MPSFTSTSPVVRTTDSIARNLMVSLVLGSSSLINTASWIALSNLPQFGSALRTRRGYNLRNFNDGAADRVSGTEIDLPYGRAVDAFGEDCAKALCGGQFVARRAP